MASSHQQRKTRVTAPPLPKTPIKKLNELQKNNATEKSKSLCGRKLYWDALNYNKIEGTVFEELTKQSSLFDLLAGDLNIDQLQQVFSTHEKPKNSPSVPPKASPKKEVFPSRRAQNIGIVLARFQQPVEVVAQNIIKMSFDSFDIDMLEKLIEIAPSETELEEFKCLLENEPSPELELRDVEKKYFPLIFIPCLKERCQALLAYKQLSEYDSEIQKMFDCLYEAGRQILKSEKFRFLLLAVLVWGNLINHGTPIKNMPISKNRVQNDAFGRAKSRKGTQGIVVKTYGFTLASLLKLYDFKTTIDSSISSLHYIVAHMIESKPEIEFHRLREDLSMITLAARISPKHLQEQVENFKKSLECLNLNSANFGSLQFCCQKSLVALSEKFDEYSKRFKELQDRYEEVKTFVSETATYFGEDMKKNGADGFQQFFQTLDQFLQKFQICVVDITKNKNKFEKLLIESAKNKGLVYVEFQEHENKSVSMPEQRPILKQTPKSGDSSVQIKIEAEKLIQEKKSDESIQLESDSRSQAKVSFSAEDTLIKEISKLKDDPVDSKQVSFLRKQSPDLFYKRYNNRHRTITSAHITVLSPQRRELLDRRSFSREVSSNNKIYQLPYKSSERYNSPIPEGINKLNCSMSFEEIIDVAITIFSVSEPIDV